MSKRNHPENPFNYGQTVEKTSFFDRIKEQNALKSDFLNGQNVIVMAPRRYGKSSLIKKVIADLDPKVLAIYVDLFLVNSTERFVDALGRNFAEATKTPFEQFGAFFKKWVPRLKPKVTFEGDSLPTVSFDWDKGAIEKQEDLSHLISAIYEYTQKNRIRAVVVLDEFQEIVEWGDLSLLKELRALIQSHETISYCFAGSKRHLMSNIFIDGNSPFFNFGKMFSLGPISRGEFHKFLSNSLRVLNINKVEELIDRILDFTGCHPHYTQMLGYNLWQYYAQTGNADFTSIVTEILKLQQDAYISFWDSLTTRQQNFLLCLAKGETGPVTQAAVIHKWRLGSAATITKVAKKLEEHGFIERRSKIGTAISDPFFADWIRKM